MHHNGSNKRTDVLFCLVLIPLCLSIVSFLYLNVAVISYIEERHNDKLYLNTTCFLAGTQTIEEICKDDICWWPVASGLCPSTFRLCLKAIYIVSYGNNQKAYTETRPFWADDDDETETICYYDKTKSGIIRWEKPKTKKFQMEILLGIFVFTASIILWIVWFHLKRTPGLRTIPHHNYHILKSEI